jgi:PIN domain nuclease of toxin-antitoxin system
LQNSSNEKWLSPISVWEFRILVEKGRVKLDMGFEEWIARALNEFSPREAPLTIEVVLAMSKIHLPHRDPADAFLPATAKVFQLTLVTADTRLRTAKGVSFF